MPALQPSGDERLTAALVVWLGLGHESGAGGFHFGFDLRDAGADEFAVLLSGGDQLPGQLINARLIGGVLLLDVLLDPGQPLLDGHRLARGGLLRAQQLRPVGNQLSHELLLQPMAQVGISPLRIMALARSARCSAARARWRKTSACVWVVPGVSM